jgi:peptidoglycan/LPS O-acetylase OafA/YrhL
VFALLDHRQHISSLDGVRGVAILMVFCHHLCPFAASTPVGMLCSTLWLGVDLFFVLSGLLITGVLYDTLAQPDFFRNFYMRRALRLLPVYVLVVGAVIAINTAMGGHLTIWALPYFVYASNVVRDAGLPIGVAQHLDVSHLWSLAVEEQFYLLWPLAVYLARTRRRILWVCAVGTVASVALRFFSTSPHGGIVPGTPYFELPMRLDSLLLGCALAILLRSAKVNELLTAARLHAVLGLSLLSLGASFVASRHGSMFAVPVVRYGYFAASVFFAAWIALAVRRGSWVERVSSGRLLRAFGRCSYGLYLVHLIPRHWYYEMLERVQAHCSNRFEWYAASLGVFLLYLLICFAVAMLSYVALERRFLNMKKRFRYSDEREAVMLVPAYAD